MSKYTPAMFAEEARELLAKMMIASIDDEKDRIEMFLELTRGYAVALAFIAGPNADGKKFDEMLEVAFDDLRDLSTKTHQKSVQSVQAFKAMRAK